MIIEYHNEKVGKIMLNNKLLQKKIGTNMLKLLIKRLNQLKAASSFYEYITFINLGSPHRLNGNMKNCYGVSITSNYRLIIEPLDTKLDMESLKNCQKINVKGVTDYHGGKDEWIIP